jgi:hypothetical protein
VAGNKSVDAEDAKKKGKIAREQKNEINAEKLQGM